jgi:hypothetical protein
MACQPFAVHPAEASHFQHRCAASGRVLGTSRVKPMSGCCDTRHAVAECNAPLGGSRAHPPPRAEIVAMIRLTCSISKR